MRTSEIRKKIALWWHLLQMGGLLGVFLGVSVLTMFDGLADLAEWILAKAKGRRTQEHPPANLC